MMDFLQALDLKDANRLKLGKQAKLQKSYHEIKIAHLKALQKIELFEERFGKCPETVLETINEDNYKIKARAEPLLVIMCDWVRHIAQFVQDPQADSNLSYFGKFTNMSCIDENGRINRAGVAQVALNNPGARVRFGK